MATTTRTVWYQLYIGREPKNNVDKVKGEFQNIAKLKKLIKIECKEDLTHCSASALYVFAPRSKVEKAVDENGKPLDGGINPIAHPLQGDMSSSEIEALQATYKDPLIVVAPVPPPQQQPQPASRNLPPSPSQTRRSLALGSPGTRAAKRPVPLRYTKGVDPEGENTLPREHLVDRLLSLTKIRELVLLKGPAGCGKTSLMNIVDYFCRTNSFTRNGEPTPVTAYTFMESEKPPLEQLEEAVAKMGRRMPLPHSVL